MQKHKFSKIIIISVMLFSLFTVTIFANNQSIKTQTSKYLDDLKSIENEYYLLGKSVLEEQCTNKNKETLKRDINFYLTNIADLENNMNDYLLTIKNDTVQYRNISTLIVVANYFQLGLEDLSILLDSENDTIDYNSLESYFYSKILAAQALNFVGSQINTNLN